ncbi:L-2-hydroxyglutarate oxidase LhgO [Acinetobacter calcoaceticus]|uniref:L-2-hydroxyglutarate oxidase LhgO n=1 Tax=Acinetobacter calcoaceticus TaxID=471 RepID=A0A4R1XZC9_ACICA|nr:L-2-hydroxyglutarate oxidase LhgO [Acinetobacter calcoaceticus]
MTDKHYAIIGGGINGLAVARQLLLDHPAAKVTVFEKESAVAMHQSSHNSGVVHAGLYYEPGGLKARLCRRGAELVQQYCAENQIAYDECGKVVVALSKEEEGRLDTIYQKSLANKVPDVRMLNAEQIKEIEPNCIGTRALYSPRTAIVSYGDIAIKIAEEIKRKGGEIILGRKVTHLSEKNSKINVHFQDNEQHSSQFDYAVSCAGLQSDRLAMHSGDIETPKIVPFFGQYYVIDSNFKDHVKGLIYPVPDPKYPFLGVHFTKRIDGQMTIGPNAFISFGRENYSGKNINISDVYDFLTYKGFWKFSAKNVNAAMRELKTVLSQTNFVEEAAKYVPCLADVSVAPATRGIRAQAMESDGSLVDDFVIRQHGRITHIRNAPSPGATSSMAIAEYIVREVMTHN